MADLLDINPVEGRISSLYGDSTCGSPQAKIGGHNFYQLNHQSELPSGVSHREWVRHVHGFPILSAAFIAT